LEEVRIDVMFKESRKNYLDTIKRYYKERLGKIKPEINFVG